MILNSIVILLEFLPQTTLLGILSLDIKVEAAELYGIGLRWSACQFQAVVRDYYSVSYSMLHKLRVGFVENSNVVVLVRATVVIQTT
jgi:hypothetical protein